MRAIYGLLLTITMFGCQRVDSDRAASLDDRAAPGTSTVDTRPGTSATDRPPPGAAVSAPAGTGPATPGVSAPATDIVAPDATRVRPDNTAVNERDRDSAAKTPLDQGENEADRGKTAEIRQRIVNAENMSLNARNVKIITSGGKVTLRGPVNSAAERETIVRFAREVAGEGNVEDKLEVAADSANSTSNP